MKTYIAKLTSLSPMVLRDHKEESGDSDTYLAKPYRSSDTLFGQLCWCWRYNFNRLGLFHLLEDGFQHHTGVPPLLISSIFPFKEEILFFPVPYGYEIKDGRVDFISQGLFEEIIQGKRSSIMPCAFIGEVAMTPEEALRLRRREPAYQAVWRQIITKGQSNIAQPRKQLEIEFSQDAGVYFLVLASNNDYLAKLEVGLRYLADNANIGGYRAVGKGRVSFQGIETVEISAPTADTADGFLNLSLAAAESFNAEAFTASGETRVQTGFIYDDPQGTPKKPTQMWVDGTWFEGNPADIQYSGLIDVSPHQNYSHPVYRYGYPFPIPCVVPQGIKKGVE